MSSYKLVAILIALLCFSGCKPGPEIYSTETKPAEADSGDELRFDPIDLPVDREIVPQKYPLSLEMAHSPVIDDSAGLFTPTQREIALPEEQIDSLNNQTFRVQLLTAKVYGEARHAAIVAEEIFDRPVSLDYEVPYFKVRVGKFRDRDGAEKYLQKVKASGYRNAWVVMAVTKRRQVAPMYLDDGYQHIEDSLEFIESDETSNE